ncbi:hypothetical protein Tco_0527416 [Tanacetum coccineum]
MDVSELDNVKDIITLALRLTVFIYNHNWPLSWLRKRPGWTKIIRPAATGFGNAFIALKSLVDHKNDLQSLVISSEFRKMLKLKNAVDCKQVVMNENFWNKRLIIDLASFYSVVPRVLYFLVPIPEDIALRAAPLSLMAHTPLTFSPDLVTSTCR